MAKYSISVFFPAYNDEGTIKKIALDAMKTVKKLTNDFEIIIIDDCSQDKTGVIADRLAKKFKKVRVIHHKKNRGYGGALKSGFKNCTKDLIFYTDGDAQFNVKELPLLYEHIDDYDIVNGYRLKRADKLYRAVVGTLYHYFILISFNLKVKDVDADFRLMKRNMFSRMDLKSNSGVICVELLKQITMNGYKIKEVPVHHYPRIHGRSQFFNSKKIITLFKELVPLWFDLVLKRNVT